MIGIRADFCGHCLDHPELVEVFTHGLFALGPMSGAQLREAITGPAARAGLTLEGGLVELLLRDLGDGSAANAGSLPLLAHTLLITWQQRAGTTLTVAGYEMTGGIHGAVARTAESVFGLLDPAERRMSRSCWCAWCTSPRARRRPAGRWSADGCCASWRTPGPVAGPSTRSSRPGS